MTSRASRPDRCCATAARAIALAGADAPGLAAAMASRLEAAVSNDPAAGTGRDLFLRQLRPEAATLAWIAAGLVAAAELAPELPAPTGYRVERTEPAGGSMHRRTGRVALLSQPHSRIDGVSLIVEINAPWLGATGTFLTRGAAGDSAREPVRAALRTAIVLRWFTPG